MCAAEPHRPRILIVDRDPVSVGRLQAALHAAGCVTAIARDGAAALALLDEGAFDCVAIALAPEHEDPEHGDRLDLMRRIARGDRGGALHIVALAERTGPVPAAHAAALARAFGADAVLFRPFEAAELLDLAERYRYREPPGR